MAWSEKNFKCLFVEENFMLLVCAAKVHFFKLQDADHEGETDQLNPTLNR